MPNYNYLTSTAHRVLLLPHETYRRRMYVRPVLAYDAHADALNKRSWPNLQGCA